MGVPDEGAVLLDEQDDETAGDEGNETSLEGSRPLTGEYWQCVCGASFNDPRELAGHFFSSKQRADGQEHRPLGLIDVETGEVRTKWGPHVYHGKVRHRPRGPAVVEGDRTSSNGESDDETGELMDEPLKKGAKKPQVKVQYRPRVFDIDEGIIHLYHLTTSSIREKGIPYYPTEGEWIRESVFRFWMEHQELVDLRTIFTAEEREAILSVLPEPAI